MVAPKTIAIYEDGEDTDVDATDMDGLAQNHRIQLVLDEAPTQTPEERNAAFDTLEAFLREFDEQAPVLPDQTLMLRFLQMLRHFGEHERGARVGNLLYELFSKHLKKHQEPTDDLFFMKITDEAGWMQYLTPKKTDDMPFARWSHRASQEYRRMNTKRKTAEVVEGTNFELRRQLTVAEIKMRLQQIRLYWRRGQFYSQEDSERSTMSAQALKWAKEVLQEHREALAPASDAGEDEHRMINVLKRDPEYGAVVAEAKRMAAAISGLTYLWDPRYGMRDMDAAEKSLASDREYENILQEAEKTLNEYLVFFLQHPELKSPQLEYAALVRIRQLKMLGRYDEAYDRAHKTSEQAQTQEDPVYQSRVFNLVSEVQIVLAQKLMKGPRGTKEYAELVRQARSICRQNPVTANVIIKDAQLFYVLLEEGRKSGLQGAQHEHFASARIARDSALDAVLTIVESPAVPKPKKEKILAEMMEAFNKEHDLDDLWLFYEGPALARLSLAARSQGITFSMPQMYKRRDFEDSLHAVEEEHGKQKPAVPEEYYAILKQKAENLRRFL